MGRVIKVGRGRAEVTISGALAEDLDRQIRGILGPVAKELQAEADEILQQARAEWPRASGESADSWSTALRVHPSTMGVEVVLFSRVPYIRYIRSTKVGRKAKATRLRSPLVKLVREPVRDGRRGRVERLTEVLAEHLSREVFNGR